MIEPSLVRKHVRRLVEAKVRVKGHTRHSKKGRAFNVKTYDRDVKQRLRVIIDKLQFHMAMPDFSKDTVTAMGRHVSKHTQSFSSAYKKLSKEDRKFLDDHWNGMLPNNNPYAVK